MYGINVGFEIAKRALLAQQYAMNIAGHNIANVNTPGFTRQDMILESSVPLSIYPNTVGTGVQITEIRRLRSIFLDTQMYKENRELGSWQTLDKTWNHIEMIFNEPSETGLSQILSDFWASLQDLSDSPENSAAKNAVKEKASMLITTFHHLDTQLRDLKDTLDVDIQQSVTQLNGYATQIANLNKQIVQLEITGSSANDLRDQRDFLVEQASKIVNIRTLENSNGSVNVFVGAMALVDYDQTIEMETTTTYTSGSPYTSIVWSANQRDVSISGGELEGLIEARDVSIPENLNQLDELAAQLVASINSVHSTGYTIDGMTGINFFNPDGTTAASIGLSQDIINNANNIATSKDEAAGDNTIILEILDLRKQSLMDDGRATFEGFYSSMIGTVGTRAQEASNMNNNQQLLVNQLEFHRQSLQGVSLDEEMTKLISYQHAYDAAAKVISTMDEALTTLINMV
ncbi:MAG: flagellar hook-associated protein FlgK [candidate division Zixibacteria bacterium]|nr:flagellar hook-associated protein FlgK [candidate division Zixibacteria bacterium]